MKIVPMIPKARIRASLTATCFTCYSLGKDCEHKNECKEYKGSTKIAPSGMIIEQAPIEIGEQEQKEWCCENWLPKWSDVKSEVAKRFKSKLDDWRDQNE